VLLQTPIALFCLRLSIYWRTGRVLAERLWEAMHLLRKGTPGRARLYRIVELNCVLFLFLSFLTTTLSLPPKPSFNGSSQIADVGLS